MGVGLLYSRGYFDQHLNADGWQESGEEAFEPGNMPLRRLLDAKGRRRLASLTTSGREVAIGAWRLEVGRTSLILLDTNLPENEPQDRELTSQLYGGGQEYRLKQEWILGVGGVRVLRALDLSPRAWHANEGHAGFMMVERAREFVEAGWSLSDAVQEVRARSIFTTHTPVPAGHDMFEPDLIDQVCGDYYRGLGVDREGFSSMGHHPDRDHGRFHMTAAGIRLARHVNGVSALHGRVTRDHWNSLWPELDASRVPIGHVTNGVHLGTWMSFRYMELLDAHLGPDWSSRIDAEEMWDQVLELDDARVWEIHQELKKQLLVVSREESRRRWLEHPREMSHLVGGGALLSDAPLTLGFARRFATYKRADLLFSNEERLSRLLTDPRRPVQIIFAGKAHPADETAKGILQRIWRATRDHRFAGRIAFVEDYEMHVAHRLVQGVDLWLNTPRAPLEASGTSGMKAALNCILQLSTLDGWWAEGFTGDNGWALPRAEGEDSEVDRKDHEAVFSLLEREIVPTFYDRDESGIPRRYVRVMKHALHVAARRFTARRMVQDYAKAFYAPALGDGAPDDHPPTATPIPG